MEYTKIGSLLKGFSLSESSRGSSEVHVQMEEGEWRAPPSRDAEKTPFASQPERGRGVVMKSTDLTLVGLHCG